jgi:hypothetical protein
MKNIMIFSLFFALTLILAMSASAYSITIPVGVGGMPIYGGQYVGPIAANLNGSPITGGITCTDFNSETYVPNFTGFAVTVETLSPVNLADARFLSNNSSQLFKYEEAAWLNAQMHVGSNQSQIGEIQFAIWQLFASNALSGASAADITLEKEWLAKAAAINPSLYDFSSVRIYTPTNSSANQEFISGGAVPTAPVPEPGTLLLLCAGLSGLALWKMRAKI